MKAVGERKRVVIVCINVTHYRIEIAWLTEKIERNRAHMNNLPGGEKDKNSQNTYIPTPKPTFPDDKGKKKRRSKRLLSISPEEKGLKERI